MKLLKVSAKNFKNLADDVEIDFVAKARKTSEDKEYELHEIAENLFVYSTMAFVGKNASGKTTALDLLTVAYNLLTIFGFDMNIPLNGTELTMYLYEKGYIFKYITTLNQNALDNNKLTFSNEYIGRKRYYSSYANLVYEGNFEEISPFAGLPDDVSRKFPDNFSKLFLAIDRKSVSALKYSDFEYIPDGSGNKIISRAFSLMKFFNIEEGILKKILCIFDENIESLEMDDRGNYKLKYNGIEEYLNPKELFYRLSSGTVKGILIYIMVVASLREGFDVIIDEIENHFHKTLVENIISLYKDKSINKKEATLIISTHYCELLDLFNRQDNIYIANSDEKVHLNSVYEKYPGRNDILKSKKFYNGEFKTSVNYEALMDLKRALK